MIFITVGSRSFQFDRLLEAIDKAVEAGKIQDKIFAQVGSSTYSVKNYKTVDFLNHDEFNKMLNECDIVLTHGGTGVIVNAVKLGKKVIAVPRLAKYKEVVDDHQIQLVEAFEKMNMVIGCYDCDKISEAIEKVKRKDVVPYKSNTENIIKSIDEMIQKNAKEPDDKKIRVLMCGSDRREKGGMNSVIDQLMNHSWGNDFEFSYLATHISGNAIKKSMFFAKGYLKLIGLIRNNMFDIIHIHMSYKGSFYRKYYVSKLCKKYGRKVIIHLHGSEFKDFYNNGSEKLKKQIEELFSLVDCTIVLGINWKQFIEKIAPKANVIIINNAIRIPDLSAKIENTTPVLLFLGALIKRKGVIELLQAIKELSDKGIDNFRLLIAGAGEEEATLKKYVIDNQLNSRVEFLGWITNEEKTDILKKADILILPSHNEGLPIAILEAMVYSLPVISTKVGSISEAVIDGKNGYLVSPGDVNMLAEKIEVITTNEDIWKQQSIESRKIAESKFSEDVFLSKIKHLYYKIGKPVSER